ncbi:hypothetical protein Hanom_Chr09g00849741 [Helianthus anomalus]
MNWLDSMKKRVFKDCRKAIQNKHSNRLPEETNLLGALIQVENYNSSNDPNWIEIANGVEQLDVDGGDDEDAQVHI